MKRTPSKSRRKEPLTGVALEDEAGRLRLHDGMEFPEIARKLGMESAAAAQEAVDRAVVRLPAYEADRYRRMMTERLEHLYAVAHQKAKGKGAAALIKTAANIVGQQ